MKYYSLLIVMLFLVACAEKPLDESKAKSVAEELLMATDAGNFERVEELYAPSFLAGEPMEDKIIKLEQLNNVLGPIEKLEFVSATAVAEFGQQQSMVIEYKVTHRNQTTSEKITVIEDEGGYKVSGYSVENN